MSHAAERANGDAKRTSVKLEPRQRFILIFNIFQVFLFTQAQASRAQRFLSGSLTLRTSVGPLVICFYNSLLKVLSFARIYRITIDGLTLKQINFE